MKFKIFFFGFIFLFISCIKEETRSIKLGYDLTGGQSIKENRELIKFVNQVLDKKEIGIINLINFKTNGAGSYDLGSILAQLIYKLGENDFIFLTKNLNNQQKIELKSLLEAGFEFGDNNHDGKIDDTALYKVFPKLNKVLENK